MVTVINRTVNGLVMGKKLRSTLTLSSIVFDSLIGYPDVGLGRVLYQLIIYINWTVVLSEDVFMGLFLFS